MFGRTFFYRSLKRRNDATRTRSYIESLHVEFEHAFYYRTFVKLSYPEINRKILPRKRLTVAHLKSANASNCNLKLHEHTLSKIIHIFHKYLNQTINKFMQNYPTRHNQMLKVIFDIWNTNISIHISTIRFSRRSKLQANKVHLQDASHTKSAQNK